MAAQESSMLGASRALDASLYRNIAGQWLTGVTVVTTTTEDGSPVGLTMNAVSPLSLSPPQFLVNLDLQSDTLAAIKKSGVFCINFLSSAQNDVCKAFARKRSNKFEVVGYRWGHLKIPIISGCIAHVECEVAATYYSGDHAIVIGGACHGEASGGDPLVYFTSVFRGLAPCS